MVMRVQQSFRVIETALLALLLGALAGCASSASRVPQCKGRSVPINAAAPAGQVSHAHGT